MNDEHRKQVSLIGKMIDRSFYYSIIVTALLVGAVNAVLLMIVIGAIGKTCG